MSSSILPVSSCLNHRLFLRDSRSWYQIISYHGLSLLDMTMPAPLSSEGIHLLLHLVLWDIWVCSCKFCNPVWILFLGLPFQVQAFRQEIWEYIIFLCGKQRKDDKFRGMSHGQNPRDILRNLLSFLSFLHKNFILFNVLRTRICILVLETFILLSSKLSFFSLRVWFFSSRVSFLSSRLSRVWLFFR